jgi:hypothetical protein
MRKYFNFTIIFILANVIIISCRKGGSESADSLDAIDQNDVVFPVITVAKPTANQVYTSGDSIIVEGIVTDDKKLYKGKVQIINDANSFVLADNYYQTYFLQVINFRLAYKAVVTVPTDLNILIEFQDHGTNTSTATIKVKVNP